MLQVSINDIKSKTMTLHQLNAKIIMLQLHESLSDVVQINSFPLTLKARYQHQFSKQRSYSFVCGVDNDW